MSRPIIRALTPDDYPVVGMIDEIAFNSERAATEIQGFCEIPNCSGLVAQIEYEIVVAFLLLQRKKRCIRVHRFCTHPAYERRGYARELLWAAMDQLNDKQPKFVVDVWEKNLKTLLLLKSLGMPSRLMRGMYDEDGDGVRFQFSIHDQFRVRK